MDDVKKIEATINSFYETISGEAGASRDWDRMRRLFAAGAGLISNPGDWPGDTEISVMGVETYIGKLATFLQEHDFYECGSNYMVENYGAIASVLSTYEARHSVGEMRPFKRGVNFIHLVKNRGEWQISSMVWMDESEDMPLPDQYQ